MVDLPSCETGCLNKKLCLARQFLYGSCCWSQYFSDTYIKKSDEVE